jgi:endogenous inhibitor of DNA gyrase (YacG/DUF329 family)
MTRAKKVRTATRLCATCGTPFTWTSRNPKRRFCDPTCKARWWRASNNQDTAITPVPAATGTSVAAAEPAGTLAGTATPSTANARTASTPNAVTHPYDPYVSGYGNGQDPSAIQSCPNCHEPVAVINLLVAPAAAYVNTPSRSVTYQQETQ